MLNPEQVKQVENFKKGFPYLDIKTAATPTRGIKILSLEQQLSAEKTLSNFQGSRVKFVPASGAATRMFKDLYEALDALNHSKDIKPDSSASKFIANFTKFPFCTPKSMLNLTLFKKGLDLGDKPKGLIPFHRYNDYVRTPFEEHLVEGASYAKLQDKTVRIMFTVSQEHLDDFAKLYESVKKDYENKYDCKFEIIFTTQLKSTDIIAVDMDNNPFVKENGEYLFRPGGHGALLSNLNEIDSDIIIIKNIDNIIKESLIGETIKWKEILQGRAIQLQNKINYYLEILDEQDDNDIHQDLLEEIKVFILDEFSINTPILDNKELIIFLHNKLNRPIRVCGMVKNEGEPGGGPYIINENDGSTSLQILEEAQINKSNTNSIAALKKATHFNPVDIVCSVKNYKGEKFNLFNYTDPQTGFISQKSFEGKSIKAQELPGLWNGAMSNWNTQFVEVPLITFNPVKSVMDLLRETHL